MERKTRLEPVLRTGILAPIITPSLPDGSGPPGDAGSLVRVFANPARKKSSLDKAAF